MNNIIKGVMVMILSIKFVYKNYIGYDVCLCLYIYYIFILMGNKFERDCIKVIIIIFEF